MDKTCATCSAGRHAPSGKVCCAVLNDPRRLLGLPWNETAEALMPSTIEKIIPAHVILYRGWGFPNRRYGDDKGNGTLGSGHMVNNLVLIDPDACCSEFEPQGDLAPQTAA